jgi:hypothetical protein
MADREEPREVAESILAWAREHGALANELAVPRLEPGIDTKIFPRTVLGVDTEEPALKAERTLERVKVVGVAVDEARDRAVVLTKNQISAVAQKVLPDSIAGVRVTYIGQAPIEPNPPVIPQSSVGAAPRCFLHGARLACGSSLSAASVWGAGTFGALVELADGTLCGLTNNHVTGGCNHTQLGMHVLCPAPFDADPTHPPPIAIGRHHSFIQLISGDPGQVTLQELDVALFELTRPDIVSSAQGNSFYDTPTQTVAPTGGLKVKKVGRSTGLTHGEVIGQFTTPLGIPYESERFRSMVYFQNAWAIQTLTGDPFSLQGDSGSLVVTEDGTKAVGLIFAGTGGGDVSFIIPIDAVLATLGAKLVGGHGI